MKILFIGPKFGNSNIQYLTLKKIYKNVDIIDTNKILFFPFFTTKIFIQITPLIFEFYINHCILSKVTTNYDLIYVKSGEFIGKNLILRLKKKPEKLFIFVMIIHLLKEISKGGNYFCQQLNTMTLLLFKINQG